MIRDWLDYFTIEREETDRRIAEAREKAEKEAKERAENERLESRLRGMSRDPYFQRR